MATNPDYEFRKLNDLLCTSFNNVKHDMQDMHTHIENLKTNFGNFATDSIKTTFEDQTKLILEQQKAINQLNERINDIESKPEKPVIVQTVQAHEQAISTVLPSKTSALSEVRKMLRDEERSKAHSSVYDIPEGTVKITKVQFKSTRKGKQKLNDEWVEITGYGVDLSGYILHDKGKRHTFKFPTSFKIYGPIKVFSGKGKNSNTKLYWKNKRPVWNDDGDVATLRMKNNRVVSQIISEPTYSFKTLK